MKNILMIAYHFPPVSGSSGIQRTLKFIAYLLDFGWSAQVLTVSPSVYEKTSEDQMHEIPPQIFVRRVFALDTAKHLSYKGRYLGCMALPDRLVSWCFGGLLAGLAMIRKYRPQVIWSTYPIASAHLLGLLLHRISGIPWVADFRDSMTEDNYPVNPSQRRVYRWIEKQTVKYCTRAVFTTPGAVRMYAERYPEVPVERWALIANGYDEENFVSAELSDAYAQALASKSGKIVLLHSGILYPSERDPAQFFMALAELLRVGTIDAYSFKVILRATGHDDMHRQAILKYGLEDIVFLEPSVSYESALAEMLVVDGLLVFQAANCNHQIPAKIYEYLRAKRPILALTDPSGDTAGVLKDAGLSLIAPLDDQAAIAKLITDFVSDLDKTARAIAGAEVIASQSRKARASLLAKMLEDIA
jgi:hypothetical protein